jgi:Tfp pilus assembly protein PilV
MSQNAIRSFGGFTILETLVAMSLLAAGLVATAHIMTICGRQEMLSQRILAAQWELANIQERIAAMQYSDVTQDAAGQMKLGPEADSVLPDDAKLTITVSDASGGTSAQELAHKRIRVEISWPSADGSPQTIGLTVWKYASGLEVRS